MQYIYYNRYYDILFDKFLHMKFILNIYVSNLINVSKTESKFVNAVSQF